MERVLFRKSTALWAISWFVLVAARPLLGAGGAADDVGGVSPARGDAQRPIGRRSPQSQSRRSPTAGAATRAAGASEELRQAYALAREAATIEQYTQAWRLCEKGLQRTGLAPEQRKYGQALGAWLLNKRGEAYSQQAEELTEDEDVAAEQSLETNALLDFERAVQLNPDAWRPLHNRGVSRAVLQQYEGALSDFAQALDRNPRYANTWFNRAEILYELGRYEQAVDDYSQVIRLDPNDADAYSNRGHARFLTGNYRGSLEDYDRVLQLRPDDAAGYVDRADAHAYLGEWSQAANDYRMAIRLDNQQPRAYQNAAWLMATCPAEEYRNPGLAVRAAQRAIELAGQSDHRSLDILAAAHASAGQFEAAQHTVSQALHLAPDESKEPLGSRLELYKRQEPYRQPASQPAATLAGSPAAAKSQSRR